MRPTLEDQILSILKPLSLPPADEALVASQLVELIAVRESQAVSSAQQLLAEFRLNLEQVLYPTAWCRNLTIRELQQEARERQLQYRNLTKQELIRLLSSPKTAPN